LSGKIYFYKGIHKVKVVTESEGYWIVEALEDFVDCVDGERVSINVGERRLVPPDILNSEMASVKEPVFERREERKTISGMVEDSRRKEQSVKY
jgi:hypothetical protein